ncbi:hypothetical protein F5J12DRAFT_782329 [Pisolithus orientalis]|uniref:uncharacterized protein n=1 Tax=Pisolithus orientalis TaxID=936130 RepID=UPI002225681E|nr:uncharacterized protein F5J12DRAFT_782329 [Pisolithus orientalis]KAI6008927.1 hypothetical protein F5J12DRAFT_782329 [Pisolithus orientalis]
MGGGLGQDLGEVNELENDKDECPPNPNPLKTGTLAPKANLPCGECKKAKVECGGQPGESCEQCRQAKQKCSWALRVGRKHKNSGSGEMAAGLLHKQTKSVMVMTTSDTPPAMASGPAMTGLKL